MARKRMISPEIWESQNFSKLSDEAKIVFISLFSHADDEGRGRADPSFVKSTTFPYDENRRVADIKSALLEIARRMSVQFYSVNGIEYYFMTNWEKWQKVEKASKSKLPPPPTVGEGGDIDSTEKFPEYSPNIPRTLTEGSPPNRIERNINKYPPTPQQGDAQGEDKQRFMSAYPKLKACRKYDDSGVDYKVLYERFAASEHLRNTYSMKWVCSNYDTIASGAYDDSEMKRPAYQDDASLAADMRGERERYYSVLRSQAESHAERMRKKAEKNADFIRSESELKMCELVLARAEAQDSDEVPAIQRALDAIKSQRFKALQAVGITEEDLLPKYHCKKCSDSGFMENGRMCDCYPSGGKA